MKRIVFFSLYLCSALISFSQTYTEWELAKDKDGIKVYTRELTDSRIKEFRAESEVISSLSAVVALMVDIESIPAWVEEAERSRLLDKISDQQLFYHLEINVPFPFDNRDMIQQLTIHQNKVSKALTFELKNYPEYIPSDENKVRMPKADGFWKFTPLGNGKLSIYFQYLNDPGGGIPAWLVNSFIVKSPFNSVTNLIKQVKLNQYSSKKISWIVEP